jgi:hypothetical protein
LGRRNVKGKTRERVGRASSAAADAATDGRARQRAARQTRATERGERPFVAPEKLWACRQQHRRSVG